MQFMKSTRRSGSSSSSIGGGGGISRWCWRSITAERAASFESSSAGAYTIIPASQSVSRPARLTDGALSNSRRPNVSFYRASSATATTYASMLYIRPSGIPFVQCTQSCHLPSRKYRVSPKVWPPMFYCHYFSNIQDLLNHFFWLYIMRVSAHYLSCIFCHLILQFLSIRFSMFLPTE